MYSDYSVTCMYLFCKSKTYVNTLQWRLERREYMWEGRTLEELNRR